MTVKNMEEKTIEAADIVVLGAGFSGLHFALQTARNTGGQKRIVVVERMDQPGGKALGCWDAHENSFESQFGWYVSELSHRHVIQTAKSVGVELLSKDNVPLFPNARLSYDQLKTSQPGPTQEELRKQRLAYALNKAGVTKEPSAEAAVDYFKNTLLNYNTTLDIPDEQAEQILAGETHVHNYMRVGGYGHMPEKMLLPKSGFDLASCSAIPHGKFELLAQRLAQAAESLGVEFHFGTSVKSVQPDAAGNVQSVLLESTKDQSTTRLACTTLVNTMPADKFINVLWKAPAALTPELSIVDEGLEELTGSGLEELTGGTRTAQISDSPAPTASVADPEIPEGIPVIELPSPIKQPGYLAGLETGKQERTTSTKAPACADVLTRVRQHAYRMWVLEVEHPPLDKHCHVMDWDLDAKSGDLSHKHEAGVVTGYASASHKSSSGKGYRLSVLQAGDLVGGDSPPPHDEAFFEERVHAAVERAGFGRILAISGRIVFSMASHFAAKEDHRLIEDLQSCNGIYHCSDYLYPSSTPHTFWYSTMLARKVAKALGEKPKDTNPCRVLCGQLNKELKRAAAHQYMLQYMR